MLVIDGDEETRECDCMTKRRSIWRMERSGLKSVIGRMTFATYRTDEDWQKSAKTLAVKYAKDHGEAWFYAGGQPGSGKTHICTAIFGYLLKQGLDARYMPWRDEAISLRAQITDDVGYRDSINPFKTSPVLYIDDFLKCAPDKTPSPAELGLAFEIINYRYNNPQLVTMISSEYDIDHIMELDEAVGSRIYERAKEFSLIIPRGEGRNLRL